MMLPMTAIGVLLFISMKGRDVFGRLPPGTSFSGNAANWFQTHTLIGRQRSINATMTTAADILFYRRLFNGFSLASFEAFSMRRQSLSTQLT